MVVSGHRHAWAFFTLGRNSQYPLSRMFGGPEFRLGRSICWKMDRDSLVIQPEAWLLHILSEISTAFSKRGYMYTRWRSRLSHCATSRKVAGSISFRVIGIIH